MSWCEATETQPERETAVNVQHELNRAGDGCRWERFWPGYTFFVAANSGRIKCTRDGCAVVLKPFPGNLDRVLEEVYADE